MQENCGLRVMQRIGDYWPMVGKAKESCGECGLKHQGLSFTHTVFQILSQHCLCAGMTFAATRAYTKLVPQLRHGGEAGIDCLADFSFRDIMANTNNHSDLYTLKPNS